MIHDGWTPLQERIKDYIAQPKSNGYQSLHTTVFGPGRQLYEIQIRTREMHRTAEYRYRGALAATRNDAKSADELDRAPRVVPPGARAAAGREDAGRVPRVPQARPVPGRDLRVHADGRRDAAPQGRDADRLRVRGAHRGRAALRRARRSTADRAAARASCKNSRHGRDPHVAQREAEPRLAGARAHGRARATRSGSGSGTRSTQSSAQIGREILEREVRSAGGSPKPDDDAHRTPRRGARPERRDAPVASLGQGDLHVAQVLKALYPELETIAEPPPSPTALERLVERMRGTSTRRSRSRASTA